MWRVLFHRDRQGNRPYTYTGVPTAPTPGPKPTPTKGRDWKPVEVPTDKAGLLNFLARLVGQSHAAVAGTRREFDNMDSTPPVRTDRPCLASQSPQLDEEFDALPLAGQLHFAAMAKENARASIKQ
jgi:hypothetical protein